MNYSKGSSLVSVLILSLVVSGVLISLLFVAKQYSNVKNEEETEKTLNYAYDTLMDFYAKNGRYPCPASNTIPYGEANFGKSVSSCSVSNNGVEVITTTDSDGVERKVAVGSFPTRSLNVSDKYAFDTDNKRLLYVVSTSYTAPDSQSNTQVASVQLIDRNNRNITSEYVIFHLVHFGEENQGAYGFTGTLVEACQTDTYFGENCDGDNVFTHTARSIDFGDDKYVSQVRFKSENPCRMDSEDGPPPEKVAILLDTSGSMNYEGVCPPNTENETCTRMQSAIWAIHHALDSRMIQTGASGDMLTGFSGFQNGSVNNIVNNMNTSLAVETQEDLYQMYNICPLGGSPVGDNLYAMAQVLGNGTADKPNVITLVTDIVEGDKVYGNLSPWQALARIKDEYPNIIVNVIDVRGEYANDETSLLQRMASETNGRYFSANDPDTFLTSTLESIGACMDTVLPDVPEYESCEPPGDLPTSPGTPTPPPTPPEPPKPTVTVTAYMEIIIGNPQEITVSGATEEEVYQKLMEALNAANAQANEELSLALSVALSDALYAHRQGATAAQVLPDIKQAFSEQMTIAKDKAIAEANEKIVNMPTSMQPKIKDAVDQAVVFAIDQMNDKIDVHIEELVETGNMPQITIVTDPFYIQ